jgi:CheY-like chemotaxis protein
MDAFRELERSLRDALANLYHPAYSPPELLLRLVGGSAHGGMAPVQAAILRAIGELKPAGHVPACARSRRVYEVLTYRYVQQLTQEETAERLSISPRHLRREQRAAVNTLARHLWQQAHTRAGLAGEPLLESEEQLAEVSGADAESIAWRSQVREELAALKRSAPGTVADVGETIRGVMGLVRALTATRSVALELGRVEQNLVAAIHPSELRQVLVTCLSALARSMSSGCIQLCATQEGDRIKVSLTGSPLTIVEPPSDYLAREALARQGGSIELHVSDGVTSFWLQLPSASKIRVLVVDDNADLVHFYKRFAMGTRYQVEGIAEGQRIFEKVQAMAPDIIVLDVMLPDVDGWELLANLHEHPATRSIPVIICSVVREEELSLALGAALYVPKPVRRQRFIQALDEAFSRAAAGAP